MAATLSAAIVNAQQEQRQSGSQQVGSAANAIIASAKQVLDVNSKEDFSVNMTPATLHLCLAQHAVHATHVAVAMPNLT